MAAAYTTKFVEKAPIELAGEFVSAVMRREYNDALVLCQALLMMEPKNETYMEFEKVLKVMKARESDESVIETDSDDDDDDDSDDGLTDSSDSGNSDSSGDVLDSDDSSDDSSSDSSSVSDDTSDNNNNSEAVNIAKLNLLVGGLSVKKT